MGGATNHRALQPLVVVHIGLISGVIFVNDEIYQLVQEQVFARAWLWARSPSFSAAMPKASYTPFSTPVGTAA